MSPSPWCCFSEKQKWFVCAELVILFWLLSNPGVYSMIDRMVRSLGGAVGLQPSLMSWSGPTIAGMLVHGIVFFLAVRLIMQIPVPSDKQMMLPDPDM